MQVTLGEHILRLRQRLEELNEAIMRPGASMEQRNKIESEIRAVTHALEHYRTALELERRVGVRR